ncbi:MAG: hypothetical protein CVU89_06055 [Firmicutes bacterium HGW-Firmicutes-14]|nr:MAG: hypothetical protein CVU89_06055 [Firmicutes bacterium HGW-Firmicutes-14]
MTGNRRNLRYNLFLKNYLKNILKKKEFVKKQRIQFMLYFLSKPRTYNICLLLAGGIIFMSFYKGIEFEKF